MTTVLIAADKFKGSLTAAEVGAAVATGLRRVVDADGAHSVDAGDARSVLGSRSRSLDTDTGPRLDVVIVPVADGGDGTIAAAVAAGFEEVPVTASGPTGEPVTTAYARRDRVAVVEMADVVGLVRLPHGRLEPLSASSRGLGEVIAAAIDAGCTEIVVGIGGSASTDGGAGMVAALGARLLDATGSELGGGGGPLPALATVDLAPLRARTEGVSFTFACDVDNPLTGPRGAAAVYGPQKGASPDQVAELDAALAHFADVVTAATVPTTAVLTTTDPAINDPATNTPATNFPAADDQATDVRSVAGAGAAGGVGYAAIALLDARLRPGIDLILDLVGFHDALADADLVVTGEGSLDEQTLHGKAPAGAAAAGGIPVVAVCGRTTLEPARLAQAGIAAAYALTDIEPDVATCMTDAARLLEQLGEQIARDRLTPA